MAKLTEEEKEQIRKVFEKLIEQGFVDFRFDFDVDEFSERDTTLTIRAKGK